ncbi:MAG: hypothetical protein JWM65_1402, partial [Sphingomonas bacterium]|nr:hypothetical protein [Sphingomonas bacterium]
MREAFADAAELLLEADAGGETLDVLIGGDPAGLIRRALDPDDSAMRIVGWAGRRPQGALTRGDVVLRETFGGRRRCAILADGPIVARRDVPRHGWDGDISLPGSYVRALEPGSGPQGRARRIVGPDGLLLPGLVVIRAGEDAEATPTLPTHCPGLPRRQVIDRFAFNGADVLPLHQPQIIGIARCIIESRTTATPITHLTVIGHTDPVGGDTDNDTLGRRRAEAVKREILAAIKRMTGRDATGLTIDVESRGEHEQVPGDAAANRRVEVVNAFDFTPGRVPPVSAATIEFVFDTAGHHRVDAASPVATALMFGLWDQAYDARGNVRNDRAETANFIGLDARRFYLRVADPGATGGEVTVDWRTLNAARANDDAPASQVVTLTETSAGSKVFVSRALLLVTDDTDVAQATDSGLPAG